MPISAPRPLRVALTGGIATGKSYVRARLAAAGIPTLDADAVAHELLRPGTPIAAAVVERFGPGVATQGGGVDRKALGRIVFADAGERAALERLVHPAVYERVAEWMAGLASSGAPWAVADIPLLYETGREGEFDRVVVVACDPRRQVERVMARDGLPEAAARARIAAQWPIECKVALADFVVRTDGSFEETDRQVDALLGRLSALGSGH